MDQPMLDIFRGAFEANAERVEIIFGLEKARRRMEELADAKPERYFVYSRDSQSVLARTDTRKNVVIPFVRKASASV